MVNRECLDCKNEMVLDANVYVNCVVWKCLKCGKQIHVCDR
jgi:hypothetical protein